MDFNEFKLDLQAVLEKVKSIANIKRDIKIIEAKLPKIKLQGTLNSTSTRKELNNKLKSVNPKVKIDADTTLVEKKMKKLNQQKSNPTITPTVDNSQVVSGLKEAQKETKTLWERFTNGIFGINLIRMGIQEVTRAIRQAISNIKELDAIKTNIQMVSGTSDSGANAMMSSYNSMAKDLSSTTKDVAEAANEFLRMGESVASTNKLIKSSQVLSKVGMIESAEAASYLISSLKGYKIAAENSMDVVSKLTSVDLEAAISAGGLAEALSKCANIADNSGTSINRLIGYTATVGEVTQKSMSEVGNSFQSIFSRMNNIKIGRFIDDETGESLSDTEAVLNKLGIQLRDTENTYRSFDNVLDDVGSRWKDFTKVEQNAISVAIAGTRQRENFEALMNNYGNALKYAETAANSAGSALERYGVYQDSIQAKTNELTAAMESLSNNVISEDLYSGIIEATTGIVEFIDKTNLLKGTLAGLVTMGVTKTIASIGAGFITAAKSTAQLTAAMTLFDNGRSKQNLLAIGVACKGLSDQQLKLVLSTKGLTDAQRKSILIGMGVAESEQQQTLTTLGFAAAEDKATISTFSLKGALNSLKTVIATNPIGVIVTAVSVATIAFSAYKQHQEEVRQATEEAAKAYEESASSIEDYASRYEELHKALIAAKGNEEETYAIKKQLLELQTELNDKFGEECGTLDLVTNAYESQTEAIRNLNKEKARLFLNENKEGIDTAEEKMTKERHYNLSYTGLIGNTEKGEALKDIAEKYEEQGITLLDEYGDETYLQFSIHLDADAQSAYETINAFENDLRDKAKELGDEHMFDDVLDVSSDSLNKAKETIENYGDTYKQALTAEIVSDDDKSKTYGEALKAVEAYNEAVLRSENPYDDQNVAQAKENLDVIKASIQDNEEEWGKYSVLFDDVFKQADTRLLAFNEALKTDSGLKELANDLEGLSDIDLKALDENAGENNSFDKLKEAAAEYKVSVDELIGTLVRLGYVQGEIQNSVSDTTQFIAPTISSSIQQIATQLEPQFAKLGDAYKEIFKFDDNGKEIFSLDSIDNSMLEELRQAFAEIKEEVGVTFDASKLDSFFDTLTNGNSTAEQVQQAFNDLATAYLYSTDTLEQLNAETANAIEKQLEEMGVQNAAEIVADELKAKTEELIVAKEYLAQTGQELASATDDEVTAFILEQIEAGNCGEALALLQLKKMLVNGTLLDTTADINNVLALAQAAGITSDALTRLASLKAAFDNAQASGNYGAMNAISAEMEKVKNQVETDIANFKPVEIQFDSTSAAKSAAKAGKSAANTYLKAFKDELQEWKDLESQGKISHKQYLDALLRLVKKYFGDRKKYAKEYAQYMNEYLNGYLDLYNSALSGISTLLNQKISAANDAKDAAISALQEEKEAAAEAYQAQIDAIEEEKDAIDDLIDEKNKKIDSINEEIDAIERAAESRKKNIQLEKDQFALEKMLNQRTTSVYKEGVGFVFEADTTGIRNAREKVKEDQEALRIDSLKDEISLIQKEIDLLDEKKEALTKEQERIQKLMDESNKYYDNLIKQQEKMWNSMIRGMEQQKSKWEELADIQQIAEAFSAVQQVFGEMGYTVEDVLNGSESAFEDFKSKYISLISDVNSNSDFTDGLVYATGVAKENLGSFLDKTKETGEGIDELAAKGTELNTVAEGMNGLATSASDANTNISETVTNVGNVASNVDTLKTNLTDVNTLLTEEQTAFNNLLQTINEVITAITLKTEAIQKEQEAVGIATSSEMADFLLLKEKILEVKETLDTISGTVDTLDTTPVDNLTESFQSLYEKILLVSTTLGAGIEGQGEGVTNSITSAIQTLNEISFEEGIITQFDNLKTAIDSVTFAISGGGESSGGEGQGSNTGSSKGGESEGKGSNGEGSGNSLTGAITEMGETANKIIGEPDAEGDGTVIGEFGAMETAVNDVTAAIGGGDSESGKGQGKCESDSDNLIGSITNLGETTEETLGEPDGDGVIGRFGEFTDVVADANEQVQGISEGLAAIDGQTVECTIKINIDSDGIPAYASGTALGAMNLESSEYNAKYEGNAHVSGTANVTGNWGVRKPGKSLVGELGQEIWVHSADGTFETVGDNGPEWIHTEKGDLIFNHLQTKELLDKGNIVKTGKAYANGTVQYSDGTTIMPDGSTLRPLQPGDKMYDMVQKFDAYFKSMDGNLEKLVPNSFYEHNRQMDEIVKQITNNNIVNNNRNMQPVVNNIHVTCPGVTSQQVAEQLGNVIGQELNKQFNGFSLYTDQMSRKR